MSYFYVFVDHDDKTKSHVIGEEFPFGKYPLDNVYKVPTKLRDKFITDFEGAFKDLTGKGCWKKRRF